MSKKRKRPPAKAADYEVGYGKPPLDSRWGPGQSGNPGGRKTGQRNFKTMVLDIFEAEIDVAENGRRSKRTVVDATSQALSHLTRRAYRDERGRTPRERPQGVTRPAGTAFPRNRRG